MRKLALFLPVVLLVAAAQAGLAESGNESTGNKQGSTASAPVLLDPPRALQTPAPCLNASTQTFPDSARSRARQPGQTDGQTGTEAMPQSVAAGSAPAQSSVPPRMQPFESPEQPEAGSGTACGAGSSPTRPVSPQTNAQPSAAATGEGEEETPAELYIHVAVPHNSKPADTFTAYPFPVMPPKIVQEIGPLPVKRKELKGMMLGVGYNNRWHADQPYPPSGWRFQYAFDAAVRRSERGVPHTLLAIYPWLDSMVPYILPEVERANKAEAERKARYERAVDEYKRKYFEIQNESTRKGLFAINFRLYRKGLGYARLPAGTWWIAGTRKVPGLVYYWQIPVTLGAGTSETVQLTEANALLIQGGW